MLVESITSYRIQPGVLNVPVKTSCFAMLVSFCIKDKRRRGQRHGDKKIIDRWIKSTGDLIPRGSVVGQVFQLWGPVERQN